MRYADGDYFGELALRSSQPRAATVHAEAFTTLLRLDRAEFDRLVREQGDVGQLLEAQHAKYGAAEDAVLGFRRRGRFLGSGAGRRRDGSRGMR